MQVFEDVRGDATIEQVSSAALSGSFRTNGKAVLNAGYSRFGVLAARRSAVPPREASAARNWLLELAYPPLDNLELYLPDGAGGYRLAAQTGDAPPFSSRQIKQNNYLFELGQPRRAAAPVPARAEPGSMQMPLGLWAPEAFIEAQPARIYVLGIIYGVLLVMLIYNLFIFLSVRDTSYLYYILYIASFGLYQVSVNGAGIQYFWPNDPGGPTPPRRS